MDHNFLSLHRHLDSTILLGRDGTAPEMFRRPSLMITDAFNAGEVQPSRQMRDKALLGENEDGYSSLWCISILN